MKYSVAVASLMAVAVAAKPAFTNSYWSVTADTPNTITFTGCENGCTIELKNGKSTDLKDYKTLTTSATGGSFTWTPTDLPSDDYAFEITDNKTGEFNYSSQWAYAGTSAAATTSAAASTSAASTKADKTSAAETTPSAKATTLSKVTSTTEAVLSTPAAHNSTTPSASKTASKTASETSAAGTTTGSSSSSTATTVPNSGAARLSSSIALIAGAVAAMAYLN